MGLLQDKLKEKLWTPLPEDDPPLGLPDDVKQAIEDKFDESMMDLAEGIEQADEIILDGALEIKGDMTVSGKFAVGTEPIETPTIIDGDLASIQEALIALGLVKL